MLLFASLIGLAANLWAVSRERDRTTVQYHAAVRAQERADREKDRAFQAQERADREKDRAEEHAEKLTDLQDELGELHDAAVADEWLRERSTKHGMAGAFVIGQLCAAEQAEIDRLQPVLTELERLAACSSS